MFLCNSQFGVLPLQLAMRQQWNVGPQTQQVRRLLADNGIVEEAALEEVSENGCCAVCSDGSCDSLVVTNSVDTFMDTPMVLPDEGLRLESEPGNAFAAVSRRLVDDGAIDDDRWFRLYARYTDKAGDIHAGTYRLSAGTTPRQALLEQFTSGNVQLFPVTLIEGWNVREMLAALQSNEAIVTTLTDEDWPAFLGALNAVTTHPEGLFLPETYRVPHGTTDAELLRQAYELMQSVLAEEWQARSEASLAYSHRTRR